MSNVISIYKDDEFKTTTYTEDEKYGIGVKVDDPRNPLSITVLDWKDAEINVFGEGFLANREILAEFLWVAATLLDSDEKYRPKVDMVGRDYT